MGQVVHGKGGWVREVSQVVHGSEVLSGKLVHGIETGGPVSELSPNVNGRLSFWLLRALAYRKHFSLASY